MSNKKNLAVLLLLLVLMSGLSIYLFLDDSTTKVRLVVNDESTIIKTKSNTVKDFLSKQGIQLGNDDKVEPSLDTNISNELVIRIKLAKQITFIDGGIEKKVSTHAKSVQDFLNENKVEYDNDDLLNTELSSPIKTGMVLKLDRYLTKVVEEKKSVAFSTKKEYSSELQVDTEEIIQEGKEGVRILTYEEVYKNGKKIGKYVTASSILEPAKPELVAIGTADLVVVSRKSDEPREAEHTPTQMEETSKVEQPDPEEQEIEEPKDDVSEQKPTLGEPIIMEATAYSIQGTTASGVPSGPGKVAVDPSIIPLGTKLYIESMDGWRDYGYAIAADTGGAIIGHRIDLFFTSEATCNEFGRRNVRVYIVD